MKLWLYLAPDLALLLVLARMVEVRLQVTRAPLFVFLSAWLAYSLALFIAAHAFRANAAGYTHAFVIATAAVWIFGLWPLHSAIGHAKTNAGLGLLLALVLAGAVAAIQATGAGPGPCSPLRFAMVLAALFQLIAGASFLAAAIGAEDPDRTLWYGAGAYFVLLGGSMLCAQALRRNELLDLAAGLGAVIWAVLAAHIGPTPDALFNLEKLGIVFPILPRLAGARLRRNHG